MGNIIIPSKGVDNDSLLNKLKLVLECTEKNRLRMNWSKWQILREKVYFIGYIIENGKTAISNEKTQAVTNFPIPTDRKAVQSFETL